MDVGGDGSTAVAQSVDLEVGEKCAFRPTEASGAVAFGVLERSMRAIQIDPVVRDVAAAVAVHSNLDVMPGFRFPRQRIAVDIGSCPMVRAARYDRVLPRL